ncbi:MAG TPA: hypothetical protein VFF06_32005 [Polyangia bacterium]|nr:hypothetical protein [Polyangia bacterium]
MPLRARLLINMAVLALAARAPAEEPDPAAQRTEAARKHYSDGKTAYERGRYDESLREFSEGYRLSPRPEFLFNMAQSSNKLGRRAEAMAFYESFLAADPESPFAENARAALSALRRESSTAPPPRAAPSVAARPAMVAAPALISAPAIAAPPPSRRRSAAWHLAWALPAAAAVITATAVGIYFGTRPLSCDPKNCIDLSHGR